MEPVEGEVEGTVPLCPGTPKRFEKPFPRDEPPFSLLVFRCPQFFDFLCPRPGIFGMSFLGDQIFGFQILSLLSFDLGFIGSHRADWNAISRLQKVPWKAQSAGQSTNRCRLASSSLLCLSDRVFSDGGSKPALPIGLVPMGARSVIHGTGSKNIF